MHRFRRQFARSITGKLALTVAPLLVAAAAVAPVFHADRIAHAQAGVVVEGLEFEGNTQYSDETLRLALRTKRGQPLDRALLAEDVNTLYGFFDTVEVDEVASDAGVTLRFQVTENPLVAAVDIVGLDELGRKEVTDLLETRRGRPLAGFRVENDVRKVERHARDKGYHFAEVGFRVEDLGTGKRVIFELREGPQVRVGDITFVGNDSLPPDDLKEQMITKESGFINLSGNYYVEERFNVDLLTLRNHYRAKGWLDANVVLERTQFHDDRGEVDISIAVSEGPAYFVGSVVITGADSYPGGADALLEYVRVEVGDRRDQTDISRTISALESAYREEGFFAVRVIPQETLSGEGARVDLSFSVEEEAKVRVRQVEILGNAVTRDKVVRRELSVLPGAILNQNEIDKSLNRLRGLGYFDGVRARVLDPEEGQNPSERDIVFEIQEASRTGQVRFAAGVSSDLGISATIQVTKRNFDYQDLPDSVGDIFSGRSFTGGGQTFELELSPGSNFSTYRVGYTQPWLFDKPITFGWDVFLTKFSRFDYDVDKKGVNFSLGRRWILPGKKQDTLIGISGTTRLEKIDVSDVSRDSAPNAFFAEGDNSLIAERFAVYLDRRDNPLAPTTGWYADISSEFGFAGDVQLWKSEVNLQRHFALYQDEEDRTHVLSLKGRLGYADSLSGSDRADPNLIGSSYVPIYERYLAGGLNSIRGFAFGGVGPHGEGSPLTGRRPGGSLTGRRRRLARVADSILENEGDPMGGDVIFTASAEYEFPVYDDVLRGVLFVDAGTVRDGFGSAHGLNQREITTLRNSFSRRQRRNLGLASDLVYDDETSFYSDIRVAVGFGLRVKIPFFGPTPIALDFGFPVHYQDGDDRQVFSFSLARDF